MKYHAHQTGSGRPVLQEDPEFQIDKSDTQTKTLRICLATQRGLHSYPIDHITPEKQETTKVRNIIGIIDIMGIIDIIY